MDFSNTHRRLTVNTKHKVDSTNKQTNKQIKKTKKRWGNRTKHSHTNRTNPKRIYILIAYACEVKESTESQILDAKTLRLDDSSIL